MRNVPSTWVMATMSDIADVRLGRQRSPKNHSGSNMRPYLRAANVTWKGLDLSDVKQMHFSEDEVAKYRLVPGDILVAEASGSRGEVGKPAVWRDEIKDCCFQNTLLRVRARGPLPEYLRYYLLSEAISGRLGDAARGVGIHHLGAAGLSTFPVPIAPAEEQARIVGKLEEHISRLDEAENSLHSAERRVRQLRAAVLESAVAGPWPRHELGELLKSLRNGLFVSRPSPGPPGTPIYRISAVRPLELDIYDVRYARVSDSEAAPFFVEAGDLLFTRYSGNPSYVGACAVVPGAAPRALHPDKLIRGVVDPAMAHPKYVAIAVSVGDGRREIEKRLKTTAGQVGIAGGQLRTVPIPLPSLDEQRRIVQEVELRLTGLSTLSSAIERARRRSDRLRCSVLLRAFAGELGTHDPGDEPASELLASIAREPADPPNSRLRKRA